MIQSQLSPSPDYSDQSEPVDAKTMVCYCCDCGDICLTTHGAVRCDPCQAQHLDEMAVAKRVLRADLRGVVIRAMEPVPTLIVDRTEWTPRPDEVDIICDECSDVATTYDPRHVSVSGLEGKAWVCQECKTHGVLYLQEPEEGGFGLMRFRAFSAAEVAR